MFAKVKGKFDVIVCNPPYIESDVIATLDKSVRDYEPHLALDGGKDGLDFYRILAEQAINYLAPNGTLVLEIGYNQGQAVCDLLADKFDVEYLKDYSNNDRIVIAKIKNH
jgi:release factor glutamine methyltransferase